jgi:hypothetical protein
MTPLAGSCHCGCIAVVFETALAPEALPLRACGCTFCRRHGARTTSDPAGRLRIVAQEPGCLGRYRFGLRTADFLFCARCGIYVAALMTEADDAWAVLNANVLETAAQLTQPTQAMAYDGETEAARRARRRSVWTPAVLVETPTAPGRPPRPA